MPEIYSIHFYPLSSDNTLCLYDYSEGFFYTCSDKKPKGKQLRISSSGKHMGIYSKEICLKKMREFIIEMLKEVDSEDEDNEPYYSVAFVSSFNAEENDYYCTYSGPPMGKHDPNRDQIYKLSDDGNNLELCKEEKGRIVKSSDNNINLLINNNINI